MGGRRGARTRAHVELVHHPEEGLRLEWLRIQAARRAQRCALVVQRVRRRGIRGAARGVHAAVGRRRGLAVQQ